MSEVIEEIALDGGARVSLRRGDLTEEPVDAIVNAANQHLQHGGGVAGAIARKGGPTIQRESDIVGFTPTGTSAITSAGRLPARYVIHAVGPIYSEYDEGEAERLLQSAVESALELAAARDLVSVAFPAISSGVYGFPKDACAEVMIHTVVAWLADNRDTSVHDVRFVLIDEATIGAFTEVWRDQFAASYN